MMVVVFRSRLRPGVDEEYAARSAEMLSIASKMPGFLSIKGFTAEDGETLGLVEFDTAEHLEAWRKHADHLEAQREGREKFYAEYRVQVCELVRGSDFKADDG